jgi:hypothetical protein
MREGSVLEGEKNVPMTEAEDAASQKRHSHDVIYKQPYIHGLLVAVELVPG